MLALGGFTSSPSESLGSKIQLSLAERISYPDGVPGPTTPDPVIALYVGKLRGRMILESRSAGKWLSLIIDLRFIYTGRLASGR
jgi:hypothetical protein